MKNKTLLFSFTLLPLVALLFLIVNPGQKERSYTPRHAFIDQSITGAAEYWRLIRNNQITGEVDIEDVQRALKEINLLGKSKSAAWTWDEMGPDNLGGRTRAILFDRNNPTLMYAGAVSGGLWYSETAGSSWKKVTSISDNMIIGCITQAPNGDIYVGTGEGFYPGVGDGTRGFNGTGIYKSTDGQNFTLLSSTTSWTYINEMAVHSNGNVYAATNAGLRISGDGGATWAITPVYTPNTPNINADDVEVASDGTVVAVVNRNCFVSADGVNFNRVSGAGFTMPTAGGRMEIAVAPSDPNYIYASLAAANGTTQGVWRTTDKGATWTQIAPAATPNFDIHSNQGIYDNEIIVYPNNKNKILVGGINIWKWEEGGTWLQITNGNLSTTHPLYVHVDIHKFVFHPNNPDIIFVGCDGGLHRSTNGGITWNMMNKNFNTIQYYAITSSGSGQVMGGTQDNSYQFIDFKGNTPGAARTVWGGDGGYGAISQINTEAYFVSSQRGMAARTANDGGTWQAAYSGTNTSEPAFFNLRMLQEGTPGTNFSVFVTPLALWETIHAYDAKDSVLFVADTNYLAGEVIGFRLPHHGYPLFHTLLAGLNNGDSMWIQNPVQSMFVIASRTALWMTREPLDFSGTPRWFKIGTVTGGELKTFTISDDGDHIFAGTTGGNVFRFSNIRQAYDSLSADMASSAQVITKDLIGNWGNRAVTSIAVDPSNNDHVVVTLGNYGNNIYVYRTTDATSPSPAWASKQGTTASTRLPLFPVYSSLIPLHNPNILIVGTEYGTYMTENVAAMNPVWVEINEGMDRVPTLMLHQQTTNFPYQALVIEIDDEVFVYEFPATTNYGGIYAGTHGRGAFRIMTYVGIDKPTAQKPSTFRSQLLVYPNPVDHNATAVVNLNSASKVMVRVFDITGKVVAEMDAGTLTSGRNEIRLELSHLRRGNYVVQVIAGNESKTAKIIKK